jgi:hypothetical protein
MTFEYWTLKELGGGLFTQKIIIGVKLPEAVKNFIPINI